MRWFDRGKNDQVDAERIASYSHKEKESIRFWEPPRAVIRTLKHLTSLRRRLLRTKKSLSIPIKELQLFDKDGGKTVENIWKNTLKHVSQNLEAVEKHILEIIKADRTLKR